MKKKWKKVVLIDAGIIIIVLIFILWGMKKTEWKEGVNSYGTLEGIECESFPVEKNKQYRITGNLFNL